VRPGDRVTIHTQDAFESRILSATARPSVALKDAPGLNPQTGPVFVEGAEPGDTLAVRIEQIEPTRDFAVSCLIPYFGGLTSTSMTRTLQEPLPERIWIWQLSDGRLHNDELDVTVDWQPFMGTFGGNMDVPHVSPGNTVYLPVWNPGALFYTGDCHARQGQGELCGVALEITAKVTVTFDVIKGKAIEWPRIESSEALMVVGSARPMEDAARIANAELIGWLAADYGYDPLDAYQLLTQAGQLYVGNMVDTTYSLVAGIDKKYLRHRR
jgi:acetamidase/formamidase